MNTDRVRLRPLQASDADAITNLLANDFEGIMQTARIPWPFTRRDAESFISRVLSGGESAAAILAAPGAELAGVIGVMPGDEPEIGYWIGKPFRRMGLATAAVRLTAARLAAEGERRVRAHVFPENAASARVLVKCGFRLAGEVEQDLPLRGRARKLHLYVLESRATNAHLLD